MSDIDNANNNGSTPTNSDDMSHVSVMDTKQLAEFNEKAGRVALSMGFKLKEPFTVSSVLALALEGLKQKLYRKAYNKKKANKVKVLEAKVAALMKERADAMGGEDEDEDDGLESSDE